MVMTKSRSNKQIRKKSRSNKQIRKKSTSKRKQIRNKSRSKKKQIIRKRYKKIDNGKEDEEDEEDENLFRDNQIEVKEDLKYNDIKDISVKDYIRTYLTTDGIDKKIKDELYVISYNENIYLIDRRAEIYKIFKITDIPYHEFLKK
jgi:hypothetical protein